MNGEGNADKPTACDNNIIKSTKNYDPTTVNQPPDPNSGGSGGDGGGDDGGGDTGGGGGDNCTPQYTEVCGYDGQCDEWDPYTGTCTVYEGYDWCNGFWTDCP